MPPVDRALTLRAKQLNEAIDLLTEKHGSQSETVGVVRTRLKEVETELTASEVDHSHQESHQGNILTNRGAPQVKDAALMFVILGGVLIFALGGMSTMFVLMMAAKW